MISNDDLLRQATDELTFLLHTDGCDLEVTEDNPLLTKLAYKFATVAVELGFDWRDLDVTCFITKLVSGQLPEGYLIHEGSRVRYRLSDLSPEVLAKFGRLPVPRKRRPPLDQWAAEQRERMTEYVRIYADVLQSNLAGLLSQAEAGFRSQ